MVEEYKRPLLRRGRFNLRQLKVPRVVPRLPLPLDLDASIYGSQEFREFYDQDERFYQDEFKLSPRDMRATILDDEVRPLAEVFFWSFLMRRFIDFLFWQKSWGEKRTTEAPPPLTVESILDFDLSMTIRHQGKNRFLNGVPTASEAEGETPHNEADSSVPSSSMPRTIGILSWGIPTSISCTPQDGLTKEMRTPSMQPT